MLVIQVMEVLQINPVFFYSNFFEFVKDFQGRSRFCTASYLEVFQGFKGFQTFSNYFKGFQKKIQGFQCFPSFLKVLQGV